MNSSPHRLCYLSPDHLEGPLPEGDVDVRDRDGQRIGRFNGIIFEPAKGRVRYLVVAAAGLFRQTRYLVPLDPTQIDVENHALRVGLEKSDLAQCPRFDPDTYPDFSDEDLLEAMFVH